MNRIDDGIMDECRGNWSLGNSPLLRARSERYHLEALMSGCFFFFPSVMCFFFLLLALLLLCLFAWSAASAGFPQDEAFTGHVMKGL